MFSHIVSILFLILLIIPIGIFILTLYNLTIEEMRKSEMSKEILHSYEATNEMPAKQHLKLVK
ncbi:hypothetical protein [Alkaliphilus peptidifermentans]|uniref:Uncharacterized protein n=1 Tax=Alkaliphilus peptidifermentans DSM 18978 TaxID=1120976 RepID=A0A1G5AQ80_9FIRM|nr:hypothetical protein [Alkaliphilus peptidifermentans]SCX79980.1 hypothetical protein SAMN03080606_00242 [Alkaliphilus peptidifermentans DSM 18978]